MSTLGKRSPPRNIMMSQSHDSDEEFGVTPPGSTKETRSLSRNAQAQARLRARRKAYVETLESNVKRLQTIVDAIALNPSRAHATASAGASSPNPLTPFGGSPETPSSDPTQQPPEGFVRQLQTDNARLRRERDALKVQIDALIGYISRGYAMPSDSTSGGDTRATGSNPDLGLSPNPGSDAEIEPRPLMGGSPLIQGGAYNQDEINQLLSFDPDFMRYLNLQASGSSGLQVPHPNTSGEPPLSTSGVPADPTNFIQGMHNTSTSNMLFRGAEP